MTESIEDARTRDAPTPELPRWDSIPAAIREPTSISREGFENIHRDVVECERTAPPVGSQAPDFQLKRLDANGALTEETLRPSSLCGRPVAPVFGSYT